MIGLISINKALPRREWLLISALIGLFLIGAFIRFPDSAYRGLILTTFNFLHYPAFFVLYFLIVRALRFSPKYQTWGPLVTTLSIAILLEFVQPLLQRSATWTDVAVSSAGAFTAFWLLRLKDLWSSTEKGKLFKLELTMFILLLGFCSVTLLKPVYSASYILTAKHRAFPQLSAHEAPVHFLNWFPIPQGTEKTAKLEIATCPQHNDANDASKTIALPTSDQPPQPLSSTVHNVAMAHCISVTPIAKTWSGLGQILGFDSWDAFTSLELEIITRTEFSLILRIDDTNSGPNYGDRFNKEIPLKIGFNRVSIPLDALQHLPTREPLALDKIRKLYLFIAPSENPSPFFLKRIFLAP